MTKSDQIQSQISSSISEWHETKTVGEFIKKRLGLTDQQSKKLHAEEIIDNAIERAKHEEKPEWCNFLFKAMETAGLKEATTQTNVFISASNLIDENLKKLIDVTPVKAKQGIEEII